MRVAVIGAGVVGLFCAVRLAQRGCTVTLLEGEPEEFSVYGPTASVAAAGMLAPLGEEQATHPRFEELAFASFDLWRDWSKTALWADGVRFSGGVALRQSASAAAAFVADAAKLGHTATPLSAAQFRKRTSIAAPVEHSVFIADEGVADPVRVLSGLCMDARRHGAELRFHSDVFTVGAGKVTLTSGDAIGADRIVLAPGAWANEALMQAAPALKHVRPAKGHMTQVRLAEPLDPNLRAANFYLAQRRENDVVLGSDMEFDVWDRHVDPRRVDALLAAAQETLRNAVVAGDRAWTGIRAMSPDGAPLVGPSGDVLVASGHSRNGWLLAPITAEIICAHVLGEAIPELWSAFSPDRFDAV